MKVLWVGDAVVSSGFSKCTHSVCDNLHANGHTVNVLGMSYHGDPHKYPYDIYPCVQPLDFGGDAYGTLRLPILCKRLNPDVIVLLNDPWNINDPNNQPSYLDMLKRTKIGTPVIAWLAVDGLNQKAAPTLNDLTHVVVWTQFAADELIKSGYKGPISIVPLGVDTSVFNPKDQAESRAKVCPPTLPPDAYLVGAVGRNQPRKRLDLTISYFADWVTRCDIPNAYLYLHIGPTGDVGCDIHSLVRYYGMAGSEGKPGRVIIAETPLGMGYDESIMPYVYSALDCYLSTSQGEGWNLPMLEAMACGVPVIGPDWAGPGSWARSAAVLIPCTTTALTAPINALAYTIGGIPDQRHTVNMLNMLYRSDAHREMHSRLGLELAKSLSWHRTGDMMRGVIESVVKERTDKRAMVAVPPVPPKVNVCVTVLTRYDLLRSFLLSLDASTITPHAVYIVDNGQSPDKIKEAIAGTCEKIACVEVAGPSRRRGLAESWNWFLGRTRGEDRIICNDDIEFGPQSIERMIAATTDLAFPVGIGFSCFLIRDTCVKKIGLFDEKLSPGFAYFEDCDYMTRKDKYNETHGGNDAVSMVDIHDTDIKHLGHGTQRGDFDAEGIKEFRRNYFAAQERYIAKWGTLPPGLNRLQESDVEEIGEIVELREGTHG